MFIMAYRNYLSIPHSIQVGGGDTAVQAAAQGGSPRQARAWPAADAAESLYSLVRAWVETGRLWAVQAILGSQILPIRPDSLGVARFRVVAAGKPHTTIGRPWS